MPGIGEARVLGDFGHGELGVGQHVPGAIQVYSANLLGDRAIEELSKPPLEGSPGNGHFAKDVVNLDRAVNNYAANWGNTSIGLYPYGANPNPGLDPVKVLNGVPFGGAPFGDMSTAGTTKFAAIIDGLSNTLMESEVIQGKGTVDIRGFTIWGDASGFTSWLAPNSPLPDVLYAASKCQSGLLNNPPCVGYQTSDTDPSYYGSRSLHPGVVNSLFCDGSVKPIKNSINLSTWRALSTTRGGEVTSSDAY